MIKKMFDDGCMGVKLFSEEIRNDRALLSSIRDVSPLSPTEAEMLMHNIYYKEQGTKVFPESGYRIGWKRSNNMVYVVIIFCPIGEE